MSFYKTKAHHAIFFLFGVLEVIFTSGIIYGWASMRFVLEREGYYEDLCHSPTKNVSSNGTYEVVAGSTKTNLCSERIERLNLVFVLSVSLLCCVQYPFGIIIDKYGARKMRIAGLILIAAGGFVFAFLPSGAGDGLFFVFIIVSCGGSALFMSTCQVVSVTYGKLKALVMCVINGSFDSSAVMLVLFKLAYERGASLKAICLTYTGLVVIMVIPATIFLYPPLQIVKKWHEFVGDRKQLMALGKDESPALEDCKVNPYTEDTACEKTDVLTEGIAKSAMMDAKNHNNPEKLASFKLGEENAAGKFGVAQPTLNSLTSCILSPLFALALFFISAVQLNLWFFIGALDIVLNRLTHGDESLISFHVDIFGYAQFCGVVVGPVIGVLFDGCTVAQKSSASGRRPLDYADKVRTAVVPYAVTLLMSILLCCLALSGRLTAMFPAYILYVFLRGFLYAANATFVSIAFPTKFFGRLYGLNMMLSGAFGFLQHLLVALTANQFKKDPFWMNLALLLLNCACAVLPIYIVFFVKRIKSKKTAI